MVVEDEAILAELLEELLRMEGYEVLSPDNFRDLSDTIKDTSPDAVILDIHLKNINGLEIIGAMRADEALKDIYILAVSGLDHAQAATERGANDFIQKPYMPDELLKKLNEVLKE